MDLMVFLCLEIDPVFLELMPVVDAVLSVWCVVNLDT
jgi:hypothetical protein